MEPALWPTLADAARVFEDRDIRFALIGGLAVSLRGQPRMTVDVDLVILTDLDRALQLVRELASTPFAPLFSGVEEVVARSYILPLRHRVTGIRVDVAIGMSGIAGIGDATELCRQNEPRTDDGPGPAAAGVRGVAKQKTLTDKSLPSPISPTVRRQARFRRRHIEKPP